MPYKITGTRQYRAVVRVNGTRYTSRQPSLKEARKWEEDERKRLQKELKILTGTALLPAINRYLDYAKDHYVIKTYKEKCALARRVMEAWGEECSVRSITKSHVYDFLSAQKNTRSADAANKDRKNLHAFFEYCRDMLELVEHNPVHAIKKFKSDVEEDRKKAAPRVYTEDEILKMLMAADRADKIIFRTFVETAARRMEVLRLAWTDINMEKSSIRLWTRKTRDGSMEGAWIPVTPELAEEYRWLWNNRNPECPWVFPNPKTQKPMVDPRRWIRRLCAQAGVRYLGFHAIRHYVASILDDKYKISRKSIQSLLRHKKEGTTERYLHMIHTTLEGVAGLAMPEGIPDGVQRRGVVSKTKRHQR